MGVLIIEMFLFRDDARALSGDTGRRRLPRGVVTGVSIWATFSVCSINDFVAEHSSLAASSSCSYWESDNTEMSDRSPSLTLSLEVVEIKRSAPFCINSAHRHSFLTSLSLPAKKKIPFSQSSFSYTNM